METTENGLKVNNQIMSLLFEALTLIGMITIIIILATALNFKTSNPNLKIDYSHHELDYWHTKSELVDEVQRYITRYAPGSDLSAVQLVNLCEEYEVDIKFVLVQGLQESHFGTKGLAIKTNSVWNVYAFDGQSYEDIHYKGKYRHPNESIEPYLKLLKSRYLVNNITESKLLEEFIDKDGNRYASYVNYEKELSLKYQKLTDTKMDSLLTVFHKQKLILNR